MTPPSARFKDSVVLITGGTGSFGKKFVEIVLREHQPRKVIVFSRDELKQHEMQVNGFKDERLRFFIGDVRDCDRLRRAMLGVDYVFHAAALKQVPACEYNPFEAIRTNVIGSQNIIEAALDSGVKRVIALSTDKAVNPVNLYGATKLCAEKLFVHSNAYAGSSPTRFSCVRYGNVVGSRGSVLPHFLEQRKTGTLTITDPRMTRFWIRLEQGVRFAIECSQLMKGGEVFIPKIPSMRVVDLARVVAPDCKVDVIGIRPGEKIDEALVSDDEARHGFETDSMYVIYPGPNPASPIAGGRPLPDGFRYTSATNPVWIQESDLKRMISDDERATPPFLKSA